MVRSPPATIILTLLFSLIQAGCARRQPLTGPGGLRAISEVEIRKSDAEDLLELIEALRPSWLLGTMVQDPSDPLESGGPKVLVNGLPPRPLFTLQFMSPGNVREIHYLTRTAAETRFRVGSPEGLILVLTYPAVIPSDTTQPDTGRIRHPRTVPSTLAVHPHPFVISEIHDD